MKETVGQGELVKYIELGKIMGYNVEAAKKDLQEVLFSNGGHSLK